jgi:heat-inducible transcriptional repressor
MEPVEISERHRRILEAIIELYVSAAVPVGSRTVSRFVDLGLSPATIRNAMADLEEEGMLEQPHLSAGRVPTAEAFRYWIRHVVRPTAPSAEARRLLSEAIAGSDEPRARVGRLSEALSALTLGAAVALPPRFERGRLARAEFVPLGGGRFLMLWVTTAGTVWHRVLAFDGVPAESIEQFERILNEDYRGHVFDDVRTRIRKDLLRMKDRFDALVSELLREEAPGDEVILEGVGRVSGQPEFGEVSALRSLYEAFERRSVLAGLLERVAHSGGLQVLLGEEAGLGGRLGIGVVAAPYGEPSGSPALGSIGVLGPSRMAYPEILGLVEAAAAMLGRSFASDGADNKS